MPFTEHASGKSRGCEARRRHNIGMTQFDQFPWNQRFADSRISCSVHKLRDAHGDFAIRMAFSFDSHSEKLANEFDVRVRMARQAG